MKRIQPFIVAGCGIIALLAVFMLACGEREENGPSQPASRDADTFTFFEVGRYALLSDSLRRDLSDVLGDVAIETRNLIDLDVNYRGFLKDHFPDIYELNQQLNSPIGERVDHNTIKLMYRYARTRNVPFDYVEIIFSEYSKLPVLINIRFKTDEADTIASLKSKYGAPHIITWDQPNAQVLFWRKKGDLLMVSMIPDQIGVPRYRISIYYTQNLKSLIETEQREKTQKLQQEKESGKTAF